MAHNKRVNKHAVCTCVAQAQRTLNKSTYSIPGTLTDGQLSARLSTAGQFSSFH